MKTVKREGLKIQYSCWPREPRQALGRLMIHSVKSPRRVNNVRWQRYTLGIGTVLVDKKNSVGLSHGNKE
jgi:hypothetical protein